MITGFGSRLEVICVVILIQSCSAERILIKILQLKNALYRDLIVEPTRPTWDMAREAALEFDTLNEAGKKHFLKFSANQLIHHSVLLPFKKYASKVPDKDVAESFLDKLFSTYKWFWPYYVNQQLVQGDTHPTPICDAFYRVVAAQTRNEELIVEHFDRGVRELIKIRRMGEEIINGGDMPYKKGTIARIYNARIQHQVFLQAIRDIAEGRILTVNELVRTYKRGIQAAEGRRREEEENGLGQTGQRTI